MFIQFILIISSIHIQLPMHNRSYYRLECLLCHIMIHCTITHYKFACVATSKVNLFYTANAMAFCTRNRVFMATDDENKDDDCLVSSQYEQFCVDCNNEMISQGHRVYENTQSFSVQSEHGRWNQRMKKGEIVILLWVLCCVQVDAIKYKMSWNQF